MAVWAGAIIVRRPSGTVGRTPRKGRWTMRTAMLAAVIILILHQPAWTGAARRQISSPGDSVVEVLALDSAVRRNYSRGSKADTRVRGQRAVSRIATAVPGRPVARSRASSFSDTRPYEPADAQNATSPNSRSICPATSAQWTRRSRASRRGEARHPLWRIAADNELTPKYGRLANERAPATGSDGLSDARRRRRSHPARPACPRHLRQLRWSWPGTAHAIGYAPRRRPRGAGPVLGTGEINEDAFGSAREQFELCDDGTAGVRGGDDRQLRLVPAHVRGRHLPVRRATSALERAGGDRVRRTRPPAHLRLRSRRDRWSDAMSGSDRRSRDIRAAAFERRGSRSWRRCSEPGRCSTRALLDETRAHFLRAQDGSDGRHRTRVLPTHEGRSSPAQYADRVL